MKIKIKKPQYLIFLLIAFSIMFLVQLAHAKELYIGLMEAFQQDAFTGILVSIGLAVPICGMMVIIIEIVE
jgi:hypothetical protein